MNTYQYDIVGSAYRLFPVEIHFGYFTLEDESHVEIPKQYPFCGEWGKGEVRTVALRDKQPLPIHIDIVYLSVVENKFYELSLPVNISAIDNLFSAFSENLPEKDHISIVVGMVPHGGISLWLGSHAKQMLLGWMTTTGTDVSMSLFLPHNPLMSLPEYCCSYIEHDVLVKENLNKNGIPSKGLFQKYMCQFTYRYLVLFGQWDAESGAWQTYSNINKVHFDYIEEALFDGTHDKLHDGGLINYHQAGKPKKLAVKWHIKKSEYTAYFWFEDEEIREVFDRFYGAHPDTKTDFMIRIDSEKKKIELALYRYGLKEPQVISESAYQLLVFKNKFEYYRSENYNQPRGAWIW